MENSWDAWKSGEEDMLLMTVPFQNIPEVLYWIETHVGRPLECRELMVLFQKPVQDDLSFVRWFTILWEVAIRSLWS